MAEPPTFFLDRTLSPEIGERLRAAGMHVEIHDEYFGSQGRNVERIPDSSWIPVIAQKGWAIITNDLIHEKRQERNVLVRNRVRFIALTSGNLRIDEVAELLLRDRQRIEELTDRTEPPFVVTVDPTNDAQLLPRHLWDTEPIS